MVSQQREARTFSSQHVHRTRPDTTPSIILPNTLQSDNIAYTAPSELKSGLLRVNALGQTEWDDAIDGRLEAIENRSQNSTTMKCLTSGQTDLMVAELIAQSGSITSVSVYPRKEPWAGAAITYDITGSKLTEDGWWKDLVPSDDVGTYEAIHTSEIELIVVNGFDLTGVSITQLSVSGVKQDCDLDRYIGNIGQLRVVFDESDTHGTQFEVMSTNGSEPTVWDTGVLAGGNPPLYAILTRAGATGYLPIHSVYQTRYVNTPPGPTELMVYGVGSDSTQIVEWEPLSGKTAVSTMDMSPFAGTASVLTFSADGRLFMGRYGSDQNGNQLIEVYKDGAAPPAPPTGVSVGAYTIRQPKVGAQLKAYGVSGSFVTGAAFIAAGVTEVRLLAGVCNGAGEGCTSQYLAGDTPQEGVGLVAGNNRLTLDSYKDTNATYTVGILETMHGLAYSSGTGLMYTVLCNTSQEEGSPAGECIELRSIQPETPWAVVSVGALTLGKFRGISVGPSDVLYVAVEQTVSSVDIITLYSVDKATAAAVPVGSFRPSVAGVVGYSSVVVHPTAM